LVEELVEEHGLAKPLAHHLATFNEVTVRRLFGVEKLRFTRCTEPGCFQVVAPPRHVCEGHVGLREGGFNVHTCDRRA